MVSDAGEEEEEEVDEDEGLYEGKYDEDEEQPSIYPKLSDDGGQAHLRSRRAIPADGDDDDAMLERADHYGRDALAMDITLASRNDRQQLVRAAPSKKRFVAEDVDEEVKAEEEARPAPPSIPSYLLTHSALLTPGTHTASSSDPAISLSSALSALPPPPSSTLPSASPIAGVSDRATGWRKAFRVGWGVDGRVAVVEGGKVTITQVRGDEQSKGKPRDVIERERKGRAEMRLRLLQVHLDFSEAQRSGALHSNGDVKGSAQSSSSAFPPLSAGRAAASSSTGSLATSTSPLAILCDRYTAALTPLLPSFPLPSSSSSSPSSFCFARQLRQAISVFQLVKLLFALEYGSASLSSLLPGLPSPSPSSAPSASSSSLSSPSTSSYGERYARLQHLIRFLQEELSSPLHPPPRTHSPSYPPLFPLLSSFQIPQATEAALSTNHLRLATLLPSLSALSSTFTPLILSQVSDWKNSGVWDVMEEDERRVWKLMAGDLQTEGMDWLRGLAMHIFYQEEGKGDVREGVKRYWQAMQAGKARPPSPPYVTEEKQPPPPSKPRRRRIADNNEDDDVAMNGDHRLLPPPAKPHQDTRYPTSPHTPPPSPLAHDDRQLAVTELTLLTERLHLGELMRPDSSSLSLMTARTRSTDPSSLPFPLCSALLCLPCTPGSRRTSAACSPLHRPPPTCWTTPSPSTSTTLSPSPPSSPTATTTTPSPRTPPSSRMTASGDGRCTSCTRPSTSTDATASTSTTLISRSSSSNDTQPHPTPPPSSSHPTAHTSPSNATATLLPPPPPPNNSSPATPQLPSPPSTALMRSPLPTHSTL